MFKAVVLGCLAVVLAKRQDQDIDHNNRPISPPPRPGANETWNYYRGGELAVVNDGPTIFGSKTVFNVALRSKLNGMIAYQWGTYYPYKWQSFYSKNNVTDLVVDWWKSAGRKTCYFIVNQLEGKSKIWRTVARNQSIVEVSEELKIKLTVKQNNRTIHNKKFHLGTCEFIARIHDPSHYLFGSKIEYSWVFDDGTEKKLTLNNSINHNFSKEGLFFVQVSASVTKNGRVFSGQGSVYVELKAQLTGYIIAWKKGDYHPRLPSSGKSFPLGLINFQFMLIDPFMVFTAANFSYFWGMNEGTAIQGGSIVAHNYTAPGLKNVVLDVYANSTGERYHAVIYKNISITATLEGYIIAWKSGSYHQTLPSTEKSFPLGLVNFQILLVDPFKIFTSANLSYSWDFGDGTIREDTRNAAHNYTLYGCPKVAVDVYGNAYGKMYHGVVYKNISIRESIQDLNVKGHSKPAKGVAVQFNITCKGSSPVSFCWYVARGDCKLPSDVMCSPTRLYRDCRNTINHTFHSSGDYCVNVTVTNTVSSAQTSLTVSVPETDMHTKKHKHSLALIAAILPIMAGMILLILLYLGIKRTIRYRNRRLRKRTEEATFDFRNSQASLNRHSMTSSHCSYISDTCPIILDCTKFCSHDEDIEDEQELQERRKFLEDDGLATPKRKISYYGTIHRTLGQEHIQNLHFDIKEEEFSPWTPRKNLSKSV